MLKETWNYYCRKRPQEFGYYETVTRDEGTIIQRYIPECHSFGDTDNVIKWRKTSITERSHRLNDITSCLGLG